VHRIKTETHRLARMQHTWFKDTDRRIHWIEAASSGVVRQALDAIGAGRSTS
jgi:tRNA A37 N6-isopentenylltransferase MiaA